MAIDTGAVDRALGAIGTTFRLTRLYPPSHPAVLEAMRQISSALPSLAGLGTVELKIGATGLHWHGQHLLPRNTQVAELAGLLFARGVRAIQINPGVTPDHWRSARRDCIGTASICCRATRRSPSSPVCCSRAACARSRSIPV